MVSQILPVHSVEMTERVDDSALESPTPPDEKSSAVPKWSTIRNSVALTRKKKTSSGPSSGRRCNPTGPRAQALFQLAVFLLTNFVVVFFLFVYPQITEYQYLKSYDEDEEAAFHQFTPISIPVEVDDDVDGAPHDHDYLLQYNALVYIPEDVKWNPYTMGWNLQDIMDLPRARDVPDAYWEPGTGKRMVQNYTACFESCLDGLGRPKDMYDSGGNPTRDFTLEPYGQANDYYLNREEFLEFVDYDFYHAFSSNDDKGHAHKDAYGGFGVSGLQGNLNLTSPTSSSYVCNLGTQRRITTAIRIQTHGTEVACERECSVVLFKGHRARRVPITVEPLGNLTNPLPTFRIDDQYLVLDALGRTDDFDLYIKGGSMDVDLSNARIKSLGVGLKYGTVSLDHLRHDYAYVSVEADDIALQDDRNYELQYRSAANLVCATAPIVEDIPREVIPCEMQPPANPELDAHKFYDDKADGYIDRAEFLDGMERLGLTNETDSLDIEDSEMEQLINHVFSDSQPDAAVQELTYELFEQQLNLLMLPLTTLYDSEAKEDCLQFCSGGISSVECLQNCTWHCGGGSIGITEPVFGSCDISQGCTPSCGSPDTSITGERIPSLGGVNYHLYDLDPPDGVITVEEMRQALLKLYGNCTYIIEPYEKDYVTCKYVGSGQYDLGGGRDRRECTRYSDADRSADGYQAYDKNEHDWRINNPNMPDGTNETLSMYGGQPRECRPFPDYDPRLNGRQFDPNANPTDCPECFLPDGNLVPSHYFNRSTWDLQSYNDVLTSLRRVFTYDLFGYNFPYFNISDDDQYRHFASKIFSRTIVENRVEYATFNSNLQAVGRVAAIGENFYLFNPWCFRGLFLKLGPSDYTNPDAQTVADESSIKYLSATNTIENTNMPGFRISSSSTALNPCPEDWGTGAQGSTQFSYFPWATESSGRKWGKALPMWCLDESWPNGGVDGVYPYDQSKYGSMAGKEIPPGCEPMVCKPLMQADVIEGSIHAQVLPFKFDPFNVSGSYHTMIENCKTSDGSSRCFLKGYDAHLEARFRGVDEDKLESIKHNWVDESQAADDSVVVLDVAGFGVPNFKKWFWTSRDVYMQLEPAWLNVFSLGVLDPRMVVADVRMTPGMCDPKYGAIEKIDWRQNSTDGAVQTLRTRRETTIHELLQDMIRPDFEPELPGSFYLKQIWRTGYHNEELMFDPITYNPLTDTDPGFIDGRGVRVGVGPSFRHKRVCVDSQPCNAVYAIYSDNCRIERELFLNTSSGEYELTPCVNEYGASAYLDPVLQGDGPVMNESDFNNQFPRTLDQYTWEEVKRMRGDQVLRRNRYVKLIHHSHANATTYFYDKKRVELGDGGELNFVDANNEMFQNVALVLSLVLSMMIAGTIGTAVMLSLTLLALKALGRYKREQKNLKKIDKGKRKDRFDALVELVAVDHRKAVRKAALDDGNDPLTLSAIDLAIPKDKKQDLLDFAKQKWDPHSDVSEWNVEEMKFEWDRFCATGEVPELSHGGQVVKENFSKLTAIALRPISPAFAKGKNDSDEEGKGLLTNTLKNAAEIQSRIDQMEESNSRMHYIKLYLAALTRKFKTILDLLLQADVPSPFDVIEVAIIDQCRRRLINSLRTFVKEKCLQDQPLTQDLQVRLGGTLDDLGDFEEGKEVIRLGIGSDVGVGKSIFGKMIRYKVAWVKIWCQKKRCSVHGIEADLLVVNIHEGPRTFTNPTTPLEPWEEGLEDPLLGHERLFTLPGPEALGGGVKHNYVISAEWGTRTIQINTQGNLDLKALGPTVQFKTVLRNFCPAYEKFCMNWSLLQKDVLKSEGTLKSLGIHATKRIVTSLKGLKLKTDDDRAKEKRADKQLTFKKRDDAFYSSSLHESQNQAVLNFTIPVGMEVNTEKGVFSSGMKTAMVEAGRSSFRRITSDEDGGLQHCLSRVSEVSDDEESSDEEDNSQSLELIQSQTLLAQFIRSQYTVSGNYTRDTEEYEVFKARYKLWCKRMRTSPEGIDTGEFFDYGIIYSEDAFHDMFGVTVNERDLAVNPMGSNQTVWYLMRVLSVWLHIFFIWLPVYPLIHVAFHQQKFYSRTTAIQPQLTLDDLRSNPDDFGEYGITPTNKIVLAICTTWLVFCHLKMVVYYIGIALPRLRNNRVRGLLKSIFWVFFCLVLAMLISYVLFVFSWLILGAVIRPQAFLPYCAAVVTLFMHAKATGSRLLLSFDRYKARVAAVVAAAFAAKIVATLAMGKKKKKKQDEKGNEPGPSEATSLEPYPIFKLYSGDDDDLSYDEFSALLDRFDIDMIEDKRRMFYAKVDEDGSGQIGYVEFEKAWNQIQREIIKTRMREAGITKGRVACLFIYSMFLLLLVFAFIFVGVTAFVGEGAFGAVINSSLTAGAGVVMNAGKESDEDEDVDLGIEKVEENEDDD
ncbi:hypothetical protein BSKO_03445 [Bryopsis sp. KO-2023]|nr:hypothetical protein BSKO_03445 [Bryopsis sp. KO-2023]